MFLSFPGVLDQVDLRRQASSQQLVAQQRANLGQFFTPAPVARLMASMLERPTPSVSILDPGAGMGSLFAASVDALLNHPLRPHSIVITAYEIDSSLLPYLDETMRHCAEACQAAGVMFSGTVQPGDFIEQTVHQLTNPLFGEQPTPQYTAVIMNPPYRKIQTASRTRQLLRQVGIETSNLYTGFLALAALLLAPDGELIAITPRSFCNGPYFRPFRELLLRTVALRSFYLFESRQQAFRDDAVLQENVILSAIKTTKRPETVTIVTAQGPDDELPALRAIPYTSVVHPDDPEQFIYLIPDALGQQVAAQATMLPATLDDLGITVSTGRVVDFRAKDYLRAEPDTTTAPLIYPTHCAGGTITWPKPGGKKPNAIVVCPETQALFVPNETYVLVKRFSSKEERRRIVATVFTAGDVPGAVVGFENHLNYFHVGGRGLDPILARGLAAFLNSTLVDTHFRQFNGHTQVNATDLRTLRYPTRAQLIALGTRVGNTSYTQADLDTLLTEELHLMDSTSGSDPFRTQQRIQEALAVLRDLGVPRAQQNERSALTLLALLDLRPETPWSEARDPLCGITPMMQFFEQHYGKQYAPNTRETVRRQTVHQFLDAGFLVANPDRPDRPVNSPKAVYQIERSTLELLRTYGTPEWEQHLRAYLASVETLKRRYAQERTMQRIPVQLASGEVIRLSPGGQNVLVEHIIKEFAERFTPEGTVLYIGDTDEKFAYFAEADLAALGVTVDTHGKMPDVIIYYTAKQWLVLIEAVTSHGPINPKRRNELKALFAGATVGLVYVTAFLDRRTLKEYLHDISWETEVWVAEAPSHLIHFNGERFLGPYDAKR